MVEQLIVGLRKREAFLLERCARIHNEKRESLKEQQQKIRYTVLAGVVQNSSTANVSPLPITWTSIFWENLEKWCLSTGEKLVMRSCLKVLVS